MASDSAALKALPCRTPGKAKNGNRKRVWRPTTYSRGTTAPEAFFCAGRLLQEYICSHWATVEQDRLRWLRNNQKTIRADLYSGVVVSCILPPHCLHATFTNAVCSMRCRLRVLLTWRLSQKAGHQLVVLH